VYHDTTALLHLCLFVGIGESVWYLKEMFYTGL